MSEDVPQAHRQGNSDAEPLVDAPGSWEPRPLASPIEFVPGPEAAPMPDALVGPDAAPMPAAVSPPHVPRRDDDFPLIVKHATEHNGLARNAILCVVVAWIGVGMLWALPVDYFTLLATLAVAAIGCSYAVRSHNAAVRGEANNRRLGLAGGALSAAAFLLALAALV